MEHLGHMEDDDPSHWKDLGWEELAEVDSACRCGICGDFFDAPVAITECGHTFCSLCLRRNLEYQLRSKRALDNSATCPQCRGPASTRTIKIQSNLRTIVEAFKQVKPKLLEYLRGTEDKKRKRSNTHVSRTSEERDNNNSSGRVTRSRTQKKTVEEEKPQAPQIAEEPIAISDDDDANDSGLDKDYEIPFVSKPERQSTSLVEIEIPKGKAQCPICGILVTESLITNHIDICLEKQNCGFANSVQTKPVNRLPNKIEPKKYLPKLCYHIMKDKELKKLLSRYQLPGSGDRKVLVNRLKEFTHRYNASLDNGVVLSFRQVANHIISDERSKAQAVEMKKATVSTYRAEEHFNSLIEEVKRRKENVDNNGIEDRCEQISENEETYQISESEDDFVIPSQIGSLQTGRTWQAYRRR